jgi:branched-chain amino acid transport system ATP-binding protein
VLVRIPELTAWHRRRVGTLSGGEQALVAIGRLLVGAPRYALLDELALGLSPAAVDRLYAELMSLRADGVGLVLVEQYAPRALAAADRVIVLDRGTVTYDGDPAGVGDAESLVRSYLAVRR